VLRPGALVVMATWGQPEQCEAAGYLKLLGGLLPPPPPGAEGPFSLSTPGALESFVERAGLEATKAEEVEAILVLPGPCHRSPGARVLRSRRGCHQPRRRGSSN
jgi:hypothetical protein